MKQKKTHNINSITTTTLFILLLFVCLSFGYIIHLLERFLVIDSILTVIIYFFVPPLLLFTYLLLSHKLQGKISHPFAESIGISCCIGISIYIFRSADTRGEVNEILMVPFSLIISLAAFFMGVIAAGIYKQLTTNVENNN